MKKMGGGGGWKECATDNQQQDRNNIIWNDVTGKKQNMGWNCGETAIGSQIQKTLRP
jgi:hypothetical protein